jgi:uncharacterized oligopeptide transporter (OPT) family protein
MTTGVGINWSLLSLGSGMLVGLRINASMLLGTAVAWIVAPYALLHYGIITEHSRKRRCSGHVAGDGDDGVRRTRRARPAGGFS